MSLSIHMLPIPARLLFRHWQLLVIIYEAWSRSITADGWSLSVCTGWGWAVNVNSECTIFHLLANCVITWQDPELVGEGKRKWARDWEPGREREREKALNKLLSKTLWCMTFSMQSQKPEVCLCHWPTNICIYLSSLSVQTYIRVNWLNSSWSLCFVNISLLDFGKENHIHDCFWSVLKSGLLLN